MSKTLTESPEELDRIIAEMKQHGGKFVALDSRRMSIAYGDSEDELEVQLAKRGLLLSDVIVSKVPEWDSGFKF